MGRISLTVTGYINIIRSYLKKVFWPNLGVGSSFQVLDILEYACGLKLDSALILNQNPFFEMASNILYKSKSELENI
jgi:hypothetical protein